MSAVTVCVMYGLQLNRVENQYQVGLSSLRLQKLSAVRWMNRQEVRLMAQAEEVPYYYALRCM